MGKKNKNYLTRSMNHQLVARQETVSFSGPLPHPSDLAKYEQITPGAAERIIKMAENQAAHRQELEKKVINSGVKNSNKGLNFGLFIGLTGFAVVAYCAYLKLQILAGVISAIDLGSLVGVFVYGSIQRKRERTQKEKEMSGK